MKVLKMLSRNGGLGVEGLRPVYFMVIALFYFICAKEVTNAIYTP